MDKETEKEISRIQLLSARYNNKLRMCPLEIKREEIRAFYINSYIKDLRHQLEEKDKVIKKQGNVIDEAIDFINHYKEYSRINNYDYLKGREEINTLDEEQINELSEILERGKSENNTN